ncbi:hypothetical protein D3C78_1164600 [compost metagenome]
MLPSSATPFSIHTVWICAGVAGRALRVPLTITVSMLSSFAISSRAPSSCARDGRSSMSKRSSSARRSPDTWAMARAISVSHRQRSDSDNSPYTRPPAVSSIPAFSATWFQPVSLDMTCSAVFTGVMALFSSSAGMPSGAR